MGKKRKKELDQKIGGLGKKAGFLLIYLFLILTLIVWLGSIFAFSVQFGNQTAVSLVEASAKPVISMAS